MELPFAVESADSITQVSTLQQSDSSLVTASSQGSFIDTNHFDGPLLPNTPQDVVLPRFENRLQVQSQTHRNQTPPTQIPGPVSSPRDHDDHEVIDFTYVNISEDDADDDIGILLEGGDIDTGTGTPIDTQRGDILTILLGGLEDNGNDTLLVRRDLPKL